MLHREVVEPGTLALLKALMQVRALESFYLINGIKVDFVSYIPQEPELAGCKEGRVRRGGKI